MLRVYSARRHEAPKMPAGVANEADADGGGDEQDEEHRAKGWRLGQRILSS